MVEADDNKNMKHLIIRNFGPVREADIQLGAVCVIIGMQSSGKSCVLKTACYCTWVEKRLLLAQKPNGFGKGSGFMDKLARYYEMSGYVRPDSYIEYETDYIRFSYDHTKQLFTYEWKTQRWNWRRPKVSYVPADRNLVASIPGWSSLQLPGDMLDFMADWDRARHFLRRVENILGTGITYEYIEASNTDIVITPTGQRLELSSSSSGLQSLIPSFVHLEYLTDGQYRDTDRRMSYEKREENEALRTTLQRDGQSQDTYLQFITTDHSEVFLEEPEDNLFAPTQCQLVNWLLEHTGKHGDHLFVATHSPYILNQILKLDPKGLTVLFTHPSSKEEYAFDVRQLSGQEVREIYDNGVDMFFNFELYV